MENGSTIYIFTRDLTVLNSLELIYSFVQDPFTEHLGAWPDEQGPTLRGLRVRTVTATWWGPQSGLQKVREQGLPSAQRTGSWEANQQEMILF